MALLHGFLLAVLAFVFSLGLTATDQVSTTTDQMSTTTDQMSNTTDQQSTTTDQMSNTTDQPSGAPTLGPAVGGVVGVLLVIAAVVVIVVVVILWRRRLSSQKEQSLAAPEACNDVGGTDRELGNPHGNTRSCPSGFSATTGSPRPVKEAPVTSDSKEKDTCFPRKAKDLTPSSTASALYVNYDVVAMTTREDESGYDVLGQNRRPFQAASDVTYGHLGMADADAEGDYGYDHTARHVDHDVIKGDIYDTARRASDDNDDDSDNGGYSTANVRQGRRTDVVGSPYDSVGSM